MKGKVSAGIFKVMAVASALAIGGGYVAWRQAEARKDMAEQAKTEGEEELELMPGSKNPVRRPMTRGEMDEYLEKGRDFIQPIPGIPEGAQEVTNIQTRLLPGSKSMAMPVFTKEQLEKMREVEKKEEDKPLKLLPGSKSIDSLLGNPNRKNSE